MPLLQASDASKRALLATVDLSSKLISPSWPSKLCLFVLISASETAACVADSVGMLHAATTLLLLLLLLLLLAGISMASTVHLAN